MLLFNRSVKRNIRKKNHFNTSNVTIQHTENIKIRKENNYFNTSNVTIQPICATLLESPYNISIHLMLLFNDNQGNDERSDNKFQYI